MISIEDLGKCHRFFGCLVLSFIWLFASNALSQDQSDADEKLSAGQIEQLVAPIALHPDSLLSQILMASTYPLELVQAARWRGENSGLEGAALEDALEAKDWDASVKSLTAFPEVLKMMNDDLAWTQQLGDAFLAQQEDVLGAVQTLRQLAKEENTLVTTEQQIVKVEQPPADNASQQPVIVIEPRDPEVVYVPAYDPKVVYGTWPNPSYPPHSWYPPGYVASNALWFGAGVVAGGALWGGCNWWRRSVDINVNRYNSFNRTNINSRRWRHNPRHRRAVPYRNRRVSSRYRRSVSDRRARQRYRGRADAGRRDLHDNRPGRPGGERPGRPGGERPGRPGGERPSRPSGDRSGRPARERPKQTQRSDRSRRSAQPRGSQPRRQSQRGTTTRRRAPSRSSSARRTAYRGVGNGRNVRRHSSRGRSSRQASRSRGGGRRGGGRRGGGRRR